MISKVQSRHIKIIDKKNCSGCRACEAVCPVQCISMISDYLGLKYPCVNTSRCIECGKCIKVCPFRNEYPENSGLECFGGINSNLSERLKSSSGGIFLLLARQILSQKGVVFGASFNEDWSVSHKSVSTTTAVTQLIGSKYVQSDTNSTFIEVKDYLKSGRKVLYSGTPCQIAGLSHYLQRDYENLLLVEVVCHGTPAPAVWSSYLQETIEKNSISQHPLLCPASIKYIDFRDKRNGWKSYGLKLAFEDRDDSGSLTLKELYQPFTLNCYMNAFLYNWSLRPSCYDCRTKSGKSKADITIGDFWGVDNLKNIIDDDKGVSCIICRTPKGRQSILDCKDIEIKSVTYSSILQNNPSIEDSVPETPEALRFKKYFKKSGFYSAVSKIEHPSLSLRITNRIRQAFLRLKCALA